jgi:hypothetical protein
MASEAMRLYLQIKDYPNPPNVPKYWTSDGTGEEALEDMGGKDSSLRNPNYIEPMDETVTLLVQIFAPKYELEFLMTV